MSRVQHGLQAAVTGNVTNIVNFARNAAINAPVEEAIASVGKALGYVIRSSPCCEQRAHLCQHLICSMLSR